MAGCSRTGSVEPRVSYVRSDMGRGTFADGRCQTSEEEPRAHDMLHTVMRGDRGHFNESQSGTTGRGTAADKGGFAGGLAMGMTAWVGGGLAVFVASAILMDGFVSSGQRRLDLRGWQRQGMTMRHRTQEPVGHSRQQYKDCREAFDSFAHIT